MQPLKMPQCYTFFISFLCSDCSYSLVQDKFPSGQRFHSLKNLFYSVFFINTLFLSSIFFPLLCFLACYFPLEMESQGITKLRGTYSLRTPNVSTNRLTVSYWIPKNCSTNMAKNNSFLIVTSLWTCTLFTSQVPSTTFRQCLFFRWRFNSHLVP